MEVIFSMAEILKMPIIKLEDQPFLKGKRLEFDSMAELVTVRAQENPDTIHVKFYDQKITYRQTNERSNKVANFLKEKGVAKGDIVSVMVMNSPEVYYTMFGTQKLGAIAGAVNYMLKGPEIAYVIDDCKPKVAFVSSEFMAEYARGWELAQHKPLVVEVVTGVDHGTNIASFKLADILEAYPTDEALVKQSPDDPFMLLYSSGTTGMPKGILLTNRAEHSICRDISRIGLVSGGDTMMIVLPMFHTNPLCVWTYPLTYAGQSLCIRKAFSPVDFWPAITENEVTILMAVPTMYDYVYNSIDPGTIDMPNLKLKWSFCGAAPLPVDLIRGFKERYNVDIIEGYGLTEVTGISTVNPPLGKRKAGSIGMALPEQEIEIMDDDNKIMPIGERGEICIKGDANMVAYLNKPEATKETIKDGWLHTGDMGYMDEEGFYYISGRKKEMINRGGENIYPREIEIPLEKHPKIAEVAVIGAPDPALGERVRACIVLSEAGSLTAAEVKEYLSDKIAKYKIPEYIEFMTELPKNPTGKLLKQDLKKMFE
jgi:long-chain acyl-CoA synthetase